MFGHVGPVRIRSDAFGCVWSRSDAFGRFQKFFGFVRNKCTGLFVFWVFSNGFQIQLHCISIHFTCELYSVTSTETHLAINSNGNFRNLQVALVGKMSSSRILDELAFMCRWAWQLKPAKICSGTFFCFGALLEKCGSPGGLNFSMLFFVSDRR